MRARIDISEIEAQTKIRAKYLRALENEEWDLLPGPTYIKSFLRTYAESLDLDAKLLVDEYKLRHEHLSDVDLQPINAAAPGRERRRQAPALPPWLFIAAIVVALIFVLYLLGNSSNDTPQEPAVTPPPPASVTPPAAPPVTTTTPPRPKTVRLQIEATGLVNVCLKAEGRTLVNSENLQAGAHTKTYSSKRFALTLGNNAVILHVNGRPLTVPAAQNGIGLEITPTRGRQPLSPQKRPVCTP
jgi:cytoskeletal protein RodZ